MTPAHREAVPQRAGRRCEYCRLPDSAMDPADFHVEHIIARKHGGSDNEDNLAWACTFCTRCHEWLSGHQCFRMLRNYSVDSLFRILRK